jgi:hypothetical protein
LRISSTWLFRSIKSSISSSMVVNRRKDHRRRIGDPRRPIDLPIPNLNLVVDLGKWWMEQTGCHCPWVPTAFARI